MDDTTIGDLCWYAFLIIFGFCGGVVLTLAGILDPLLALLPGAMILLDEERLLSLGAWLSYGLLLGVLVVFIGGWLF